MTSAVIRPLDERRFDVVLFGATGFTGKLVAEYFASRGPPPRRWAIAGRDAAKLESVRRDLAAIDPALSSLAIRVADARDEAALEGLARDARVVCTTVGPYVEHGAPLVRACARLGTSYCDLSGEIPFIRRSIDELDELARRTKARIVHAAGYDSVPFDLGVYVLWDEAKRRGERGLAWAKGFAGRTKGGVSGGTIASMIEIVERATRDPDVRRLIVDPHALEPGTPRTDDPFEADQRGVRFDRDLGRWTAPFLMAVVNTRIVRRSNALLQYGRGFRYHEATSMAKGVKGLAMASLLTTGTAAFASALVFRPTRRLLQGVLLPAPGEGPSRETIAGGHFESIFVAETENGTPLRGRVAGSLDPGYGATARMCAESALCLAEGTGLDDRYGVLTPASAMGMRLVERLRDAGMILGAEA